jgi:endothelin-converting enzyme
MSLKEASSLAPQLQLSTILNGLAPSDVQVDRLIVMSPTYMTNLSSILDQTPKKVLQTYLVWKAIQTYSSVVEADEVKPYTEFSNELEGKVSFSQALC